MYASDTWAIQGAGMAKSRWVVGDKHRIWWQDGSTFVEAEVFRTADDGGIRACLVFSYDKTRVVTWLTWEQVQMLKCKLT
jgi:hypothetical protein